jgi:hypothetical protein
MSFILAASALNLLLMSVRAAWLRPPVRRTDRGFLVVLAGCLAADLLAAYGFYELIREPPTRIGSYSLVITVMALLAAASVIFRFAFPGDGTALAARVRAVAASSLVTVSLYLLFGSIAYFAQVMQETRFILISYAFVPAVMLAILWVSTVYDAWEFTEPTG